MSARSRTVLVVLCLLFHSGAVARTARADDTGLVVAVVEQRSEAGRGEIHYSVAFGDSKLHTTLDILNALNTRVGKKLAILVRQDVPIGTLSTLVSMATKAGFRIEDIHYFIFHADRRSMAELPGFKIVVFSTDPTVVGGLLTAR